MPLLIKVSLHGKRALRFCVPADISKKYKWSKYNTFMLYAYDDKILVVEPTVDFKTTTSFIGEYNHGNKIFYTNPCKNFKVFSFYIPMALTKKLNLINTKLLAVHESGDQAIFLEAFPDGSQTR